MSLDMFAQEADVETTSTDSVGGFSPFESDVIPMTIAMAYLDQAKSKAASVNLILKDATGKELTVTEYITSGEAKGCKPYYINKKSGKKVALPGWSKINDLCLAATGKEFKDQDAEDKTIEIYDYEAKAKKPQQKKVIMTLLNQKVKVGVLLVKADKSAKDAAGVYQPTGETREINEADKFFNIDTELTTAEVSAGSTEPKFMATWLKKWKGEVKDTSTKVTGSAAGAPAGTGAPTTASLFPE